MQSSEQPTVTVDVLDSRASWYRTMARHSRGAESAFHGARADLARRYWRRRMRALEAKWAAKTIAACAVPFGWSVAG